MGSIPWVIHGLCWLFMTISRYFILRKIFQIFSSMFGILLKMIRLNDTSTIHTHTYTQTRINSTCLFIGIFFHFDKITTQLAIFSSHLPQNGQKERSSRKLHVALQRHKSPASRSEKTTTTHHRSCCVCLC